jgi:hypothetical protein
VFGGLPRGQARACAGVSAWRCAGFPPMPESARYASRRWRAKRALRLGGRAGGVRGTGKRGLWGSVPPALLTGFLVRKPVPYARIAAYGAVPTICRIDLLRRRNSILHLDLSLSAVIMSSRRHSSMMQLAASVDHFVALRRWRGSSLSSYHPVRGHYRKGRWVRAHTSFICAAVAVVALHLPRSLVRRVAFVVCCGSGSVPLLLVVNSAGVFLSAAPSSVR